MSLKTNIWFIRALVIGLNWLKFDNSRLDWLNQKHGQNWRLKTNAWANIGLSHVFLSTSNINYFYFVPCSASSSLMSLYFRLLWWILPWIKHWNSCKSLPMMQKVEKFQKIDYVLVLLGSILQNWTTLLNVSSGQSFSCWILFNL